MKQAFVSTSPLFSLFPGCELESCVILVRHPGARRVHPADQPRGVKKRGPSGKECGETSGGKQREAMSNKDAAEQSAVSQI